MDERPDGALRTAKGITWAERLELDLEKLGNDISHGVVEERIKEDRQSGIRSGVNGTPTVFITRFDGPPDYGSLLAALESELALRPCLNAPAE